MSKRKRHGNGSCPPDIPSDPPCCEVHPKRYTSPNSRLTQGQLEALQRCIGKANDLLRSLGNEPNPVNTRQLQLHFLQMRGLWMTVTLVQEDCTVVGKVVTAGRDFIEMENEGKILIIGFEQILSLEREKIYLPPDEVELICVEQDIRGELVFNFGEFVSERPELVNLFFGNYLFNHLSKFIGKKVSAKMINDEFVEGELLSSTQNGITIRVGKDEVILLIESLSIIEVC